MADYYRILNLEPSADEAEVRKAFNREMRIWSNRTNAPQMERRQEAERMVKLLEEAEGVLLDSARRADYDRSQQGSQGRSRGCPNASPDRPRPREKAAPSAEQGGDASSLIEEGWQLLIDDRIEEALEVAARATELEPANADAWALLGQAKFRSGEIDDAIYEYKRAIKLRSNEASYFGDLGSIYESIERWDEAVQQYERAAQIDPKTTMYRAAIGIVHVKTGNLEKAVEILERCVREEPGNESYQRALGYAYVDDILSNWWKHEDKYYCLSVEQAEGAKVILEKARSLRFDDADLRRQLEERGKLIESMFARQFKGSWAMVILLGMCGVFPGVLWWWANRRPAYKINRDIHDVVEHNKADAVVGGELGAYFSALPPGLKWMAYVCPRVVVWFVILLFSPLTFLYLIYDNYGAKHLAGFAGASAMLLAILAVTSSGNRTVRPGANVPSSQASSQLRSAVQSQTVLPPTSQTRIPNTGYAPVMFGNEKLIIFPETRSSDGRHALGWTVHGASGRASVNWAPFENPNREASEIQLSNVDDVVLDLKSGKILAKLAFESPYFRSNILSKNHGNISAYWGPEQSDRSFALIVNHGKWASLDVRLLQIEGVNLGQTDAYSILASAVQSYIAKVLTDKARDYLQKYAIGFGETYDPLKGVSKGFIGYDTLRLPFYAEVPKSETDRAFNGIVVAKAVSNMTAFKPALEVLNVVESQPVKMPDIRSNTTPAYPSAMVSPRAQVNSASAPPVTNAADSSNGKPVLTIQQVIAFVQLHAKYEVERNIEASLRDYAPRIRYFDHGTVDQAFIRKDKSAYFNKWHFIQQTITGNILVNERKQQNFFVSFPSTFRVENYRGEWVSGTVDNSMWIVNVNGEMKIQAEDGKVANKQKGNRAGVQDAHIGNLQAANALPNFSRGTWKQVVDTNDTTELLHSIDTLTISGQNVTYQIETDMQFLGQPPSGDAKHLTNTCRYNAHLVEKSESKIRVKIISGALLRQQGMSAQRLRSVEQNIRLYIGAIWTFEIRGADLVANSVKVYHRVP